MPRSRRDVIDLAPFHRNALARFAENQRRRAGQEDKRLIRQKMALQTDRSPRIEPLGMAKGRNRLLRTVHQPPVVVNIRLVNLQTLHHHIA